MYIPKPFVVGPDAARDLLREVTVAQLVTATEQGPLATLLPWVVDLDHGSLIGHMARPNAQWQTPWYGQALVIAEGPNGYVSPSWYASKAEHGRVVPTWDYVVVHVYGDLLIHDDEAWVEASVRRLTDRHEQPRPEPWSVSDAPDDYINGQLRGVVGIELRIDRVEASVKMSQGKSAADAAGVVAGFTADGNAVVADWVRRSTT
ncbi:MAG: FMN-binding negative transcriptional regulator [Candidatus Nanopelagicales bacterium]